jgi:hypothetical protein
VRDLAILRRRTAHTRENRESKAYRNAHTRTMDGIVQSAHFRFPELVKVFDMLDPIVTSRDEFPVRLEDAGALLSLVQDQRGLRTYLVTYGETDGLDMINRAPSGQRRKDWHISMDCFLRMCARARKSAGNGPMVRAYILYINKCTLVHARLLIEALEASGGGPCAEEAVKHATESSAERFMAYGAALRDRALREMERGAHA